MAVKGKGASVLVRLKTQAKEERKVIQRLVDFLEPVYISIMQGSSFYMWWSSEKRLWKDIQ